MHRRNDGVVIERIFAPSNYLRDLVDDRQATADDINIRMIAKKRQLALEAIGLANVVRVSAADELPLRFGQRAIVLPDERSPLAVHDMPEPRIVDLRQQLAPGRARRIL